MELFTNADKHICAGGVFPGLVMTDGRWVDFERLCESRLRHPGLCSATLESFANAVRFLGFEPKLMCF